uniref:NAC domain-containing protein n=1 Tax=Salix viminalis TaxID=40686 RepID=A0A6N2M9A2_SALVM
MSSPNLPPGFRFCPSDQELVLHFLHRKAALLPSHPYVIIPDLDLYPYDPWQLEAEERRTRLPAMDTGSPWPGVVRSLWLQVITMATE